MKPRLRPVLMTDEDWAIWCDHRGDARRGYVLGWHLAHGRDADRRDAEVMLQLTTFDYWERDYTEDRVRRWPTAQRVVRNQL